MGKNKIKAVLLAGILALAYVYPRPVLMDSPVPSEAIANTVLLELKTESGSTGFGSGVVLPNRLILTARHCVDRVSSVRAVMLDENGKDAAFFVCEVVKVCTNADVALLRVTSKDFNRSGVRLASSFASPGTVIFHVGNYHGREGYLSFSKGVVAYVDRKAEGLTACWPDETLDQVNILILPGSSGGGVFNSAGELVGIAVGGAGPGWAVMVPVRVIEKWLCQ